jgi:hypothetical protein
LFFIKFGENAFCCGYRMSKIIFTFSAKLAVDISYYIYQKIPKYLRKSIICISDYAYTFFKEQKYNILSHSKQ